MVIFKVQSISTICQVSITVNRTLHHLASFLDGEALTNCMGYNPRVICSQIVYIKCYDYNLKVCADIVAMTPTLAATHKSYRNSPRSHSYKHILVVKMIILTN